jgi:hypothetical protein
MAKKPTALVREPEVLDALEQEVALIKTDSSLIEQFAGKLRAFFVRARELELTAKANLTKANLLKLPATMPEDERLQFFVKNVGADRKDALEHWDITQKVSQFHKRLVAARKRSEEPNEQAIVIATRLHNTYVDTERRRVAVENERLRQQAEQKAAADRAAELAELERQAVAAEEASEGLSDRERRFVEHYMRTGNGRLAAQAVGFKDADKQAARLLSLPKILAACDAVKQAEVLREQRAAIAEKPLDVQADTVQANISKAGGHDRSTHSAELLDERALVEAVLAGGRGIPSDILQVNQAKLNEYARSLHELINRWPGVRYKKTTSLV